jgi:hypothetical protein
MSRETIRADRTPRRSDLTRRARPPDVGRHARKCCICRHPKRDAIEAAFLGWRSPDVIADEYGLPGRNTRLPPCPCHRALGAAQAEYQYLRGARHAAHHESPIPGRTAETLMPQVTANAAQKKPFYSIHNSSRNPRKSLKTRPGLVFYSIQKHGFSPPRKSAIRPTTQNATRFARLRGREQLQVVGCRKAQLPASQQHAGNISR